MDDQKFVVDFKPIITYRFSHMFSHILVHMKGSGRKPWDYLHDWAVSDRGYDPDEMTTINQKMQEMYPGPYKVVKKLSPYERFYTYEMEFNSPAEETMYRLKWA